MKNFRDIFTDKDGHKIWRKKDGSFSWSLLIFTIIFSPFILIWIIASISITLILTPAILVLTIKFGEGNSYAERLRSNYNIVFRKTLNLVERVAGSIPI